MNGRENRSRPHCGHPSVDAREILYEGVAPNRVAGSADTAALRSGCGPDGAERNVSDLRPSLNNHRNVWHVAPNPTPFPLFRCELESNGTLAAQAPGRSDSGFDFDYCSIEADALVTLR